MRILTDKQINSLKQIIELLKITDPDGIKVHAEYAYVSTYPDELRLSHAVDAGITTGDFNGKDIAPGVAAEVRELVAFITNVDRELNTKPRDYKKLNDYMSFVLDGHAKKMAPASREMMLSLFRHVLFMERGSEKREWFEKNRQDSNLQKSKSRKKQQRNPSVEIDIGHTASYPVLKGCDFHFWKKGECGARHIADTEIKFHPGNTVETGLQSDGNQSFEYKFKHVWDKPNSKQHALRRRIHVVCHSCPYRTKFGKVR
ncbi:MAG: hypothetical protein FWD15_06305 [Alphaproteobacteria bacterium]|nr:hypothetical protein [Alphaproteobacteria bacterium]